MPGNENNLYRKKIHELPKQMADKIAAGEVVDRPVSIVKELVENSIDAGASKITVEIKNGGKSYIRVTDNGCGIASDETSLAFMRHATSKLSKMSDLDAVATLGFRGEALASIAAVSRVELITRTAGETAGTAVMTDGGVNFSSVPTGCPEGTTVIVRDLFFNTPARLKFLKKDNAESTLIIDLVSKIALAYPDIAVRLVNNGSTLFATRGMGDTLNSIATVYDPSMAGKLIHFEKHSDGGIYVEGYISSPDETRANRKNQIFFVNGRYIHSKLFEQCISEAYREKLFEGRHPVAFIFLTLPPDQTDVNIHPNKKEIRFDDENTVREFLTSALRDALKAPEAVPEFTFKKDKLKENRKQPSPAEKQEQLDIRRILKQKRVSEENAVLSPSEAVSGGSAGRLHKAETYSDSNELSGRTQPEPEGLFVPRTKEPEKRFFDVSDIRYVGIIFAEYIIGCDDSSFYLIDQHAAHERVFYEKLTREFYSQETAGQILALPFQVSVSHSVENEGDEWAGFLKGIGFAVEEFGPRTYAVKEIPAYMSVSEAENFIRDFFDSIGEPGAFRDRHRTDMIITKACKSAVKANDSLDPKEAQHLLNDLSECINPFSCPHGRPVIIRMKKKEIDALFKR